MASFRKIGRNWFFRYVDANGVQRERKGCPDRRVSEELARAAESEAAKIRSGILDPKSVAYGVHEARSLSDHLADWYAYLLGKGATPKHAQLSRNRVARLIDLARTRKVSDLSPSRLQAALKAVRDGDKEDAGVSLRSLHHYTRVVKGFSRWLWRDGRAREDTLAHLTSPNPDADRRRERRALSPDEMARLIEAAETGPVVLKTSGSDRAILYRLALGTGFRANELRSLTPESFHLEDDTPTIKVAAAYSKRRRDDMQPIRSDLAATIRSWLASRPAGKPVFGNLTTHTNLLIKADLERAGIAYWDASDRVADFHALRHSYVTALAMCRAPVKVVQSLARHSTPALTLGIYSHVGLFDQSATLDALPGQAGPTGPRTEAATLAATGTDGPISNLLSLHFPYGGDGIGRIVTDAGEIDTPNSGRSPEKSACRNSLGIGPLVGPGRSLAGTDGSGGGGIRTHGRFEASAVFKTAAIDHSATPPIVPTPDTRPSVQWPTSSRTSSET